MGSYAVTIQLVIVILYTKYERCILYGCEDICDEKCEKERKRNKYREELTEEGMS